MQIRNFFEETRAYLANNIVGAQKNHHRTRKAVSIISAPISIFFVIGNYFTFLNLNDIHSWKGIIFFFLSFTYGLFCFWLLLEKFWKNSW